MMVSSKFSVKPPPFRVPKICKKKTPEQQGNAEPNDTLNHWYDVDVSWFFYHWVFSGSIQIEKQFDHHWQSVGPPPVDGQTGTFQWFPAGPAFSASVTHYQGGVQILTLNITNEPYSVVPDFDTGEFDYTSALWAGKKKGRDSNQPV